MLLNRGNVSLSPVMTHVAVLRVKTRASEGLFQLHCVALVYFMASNVLYSPSVGRAFAIGSPRSIASRFPPIQEYRSKDRCGNPPAKPIKQASK